MRNKLLILVAGLAAAALVYFLFVVEPQTDSGGGDLLQGADGGSADPGSGGGDGMLRTSREDLSGARVIEREPAGLWDHVPEPGTSKLEDIQLLERRIELPEGAEKLTGDMVLRGLAEVFGADRPFQFVGGASLAAFRALEFEMPPPGQASVAELLALIPIAGYRPIERGGEFYIVPLRDE